MFIKLATYIYSYVHARKRATHLLMYVHYVYVRIDIHINKCNVHSSYIVTSNIAYKQTHKLTHNLLVIT